MKRTIRMNEIDQVATALEDICPGDTVGVYNSDNILLYTMMAKERIPFGNKIALCDIEKDSLLIKYGAPVGLCTHNIQSGMLVHIHNVKSRTVDIPQPIRQEIMRQMNIREVEE